MKLKGENVLVRPEPWTVMKLGSILLPENTKQVFARGVVVTAGPGPYTINGVQLAIEVKEGDHILYWVKAAIDITLDGENMHIVTEREILGVFEPGEYGELEKHDAEETEGETTDAIDN